MMLEHSSNPSRRRHPKKAAESESKKNAAARKESSEHLRCRPKPKKPRKDFPLFAHANGQWAKKVRGRHYYFGNWEDPEAAERLWDLQKVDLRAGRNPVQNSDKSITVKELCNHFLAYQKRRVENDELSRRQYEDSHRAALICADSLGRDFPVPELRPRDFERVHVRLVDKHKSPKSLKREISNVKAIFNYGEKQELFDCRIRFGTFQGPKRSAMRKYEQKQKLLHGEKFLEPWQCRLLIDNASSPMKAMILLGLNCGFGNTDVRMLQFGNIDLDEGWVDYPRPKTGIDRVAKLWDATVEAIEHYLKRRREPKDPDLSGTIFITKYGNAFGRGERGKQPISAEFYKLLNSQNLYRTGLSFYTLRRTYRTIADTCRDQPAVNLTMGHVDETMGAVYRQHISRDRIQAVSVAVRSWLFGCEGVQDDTR